MSEFNLIKTSAGQFLSNPTWDIILVLALGGIGFFYGILAGKQKILSSIVYTYVAFAIFSVVPFRKFSSFLQLKNEFASKITLFLALFIALFFLTGIKRGRNHTSISKWWQVFLLSIVQAGFLAHIILNFLPPEIIKTLAPLTKKIFANPDLRFWWFIIPIGAVIILKKLGRNE